MRKIAERVKRLTKRERKKLYGKGRYNKWNDFRKMGYNGPVRVKDE